MDALQVDFMAGIHGVLSLVSLRNRAVRSDFGGHELLVADLADIIKNKRAAGARGTGPCSKCWKRR